MENEEALNKLAWAALKTEGEIKIQLILRNPVATEFLEQAEKEVRGLSPHARYCIKTYYEWKPEILWLQDRCKNLEAENETLKKEINRLRRYVVQESEEDSEDRPGPDFRPQKLRDDDSEDDPQESAG